MNQMEIVLTKNKIALIDDEDLDLILEYKWRTQLNQDGRFYAIAWNTYPNFVLMHRIVTNCPVGMIVDHVDGDGLNNQKYNLRVTTYSVNNHNRSDVKGYHWESSRNKWKAMIMVDGKAHFLGRFNREEEAALAYKEAKDAFFPELVEAE